MPKECVVILAYVHRKYFRGGNLLLRICRYSIIFRADLHFILLYTGLGAIARADKMSGEMCPNQWAALIFALNFINHLGPTDLIKI